jgi:hypothetical protein
MNQINFLEFLGIGPMPGTNGAGLPGSTLAQMPAAGGSSSPWTSSNIAAGAGVAMGLIEGYAANKIYKTQLEIRGIEKDIANMQSEGRRDEQLRTIYKKKEMAMEAIAEKSKSDNEKMKQNESMARVAMAAKGFAGGASAGEARQALINARMKQEQLNLNEWSNTEEMALIARSGVESQYIYERASNAIRPMIDFQAPNVGQAGLDMMIAYSKYKNFLTDQGDIT